MKRTMQRDGRHGEDWKRFTGRWKQREAPKVPDVPIDQLREWAQGQGLNAARSGNSQGARQNPVARDERLKT